MKGEHVDLIIHNARVHAMDENMSIEEAIAIRDGKIIEVGPERQILNKYRSDETIDALGKDVYPGFTDAHGHIFAYANQKMSVDLVGSKSMNEVIYRCEKYLSLTGKKFIVGRGWDQTLFSDKEMPNYKALSEKFKNIPVCPQIVPQKIKAKNVANVLKFNDFPRILGSKKFPITPKTIAKIMNIHNAAVGSPNCISA
jgi:predicted amidohydrolase YtcJ